MNPEQSPFKPSLWERFCYGELINWVDLYLKICLLILLILIVMGGVAGIRILWDRYSWGSYARGHTVRLSDSWPYSPTVIPLVCKGCGQGRSPWS